MSFKISPPLPSLLLSPFLSLFTPQFLNKKAMRPHDGFRTVISYVISLFLLQLQPWVLIARNIIHRILDFEEIFQTRKKFKNPFFIWKQEQGPRTWFSQFSPSLLHNKNHDTSEETHDLLLNHWCRPISNQEFTREVKWLLISGASQLRFFSPVFPLPLSLTIKINIISNSPSRPTI